MAVDGTSIKSDIDSDLAGKGYRGIRIATIITTLKKVVDWVTGVVNGNLSTWYKVGTSNTPATNAEDVYRMGRLFAGKSTDDGTGSALQADTFSIAGVPFLGVTSYTDGTTLDFDTLTKVGTYAIGGSGWLAGGHGPGNTFTGVFTYGTLLVFRSSSGGMVQMYIDNSQNYLYQRMKWFTNSWGPWVCASRPLDFKIANTLIFEPALATKKLALYDYGSDHQFFGFGIANSILRYQVGDTCSAHIFFAATSPTTSNELARIQGDGKMGIGTTSITSVLHLKAAAGHYQFRLETAYTPSSSSDANGALGQICWDTNYFYVKTSAGWKRSALTTF